jgi:alkylation response protein AidB-like acyl-CoA dehydrogenase
VVFIGQSIITYGSEEQKQYFLPRIAKGEFTWAWCLTEPNSGSDAASLKTKAVKVPGGYKINGQKVFITGAHVSTHGMVAVRTNPDVPKHKGISLFLLPLDQPGITIRPIWTMRGWRVNEIFFDDVFVPDDRLLGGLDQGWNNIRQTLSFERSAIAQVGNLFHRYDDLMNYLRARGETIDKTLSARLATIKARITAARWMGYKVAWMQDREMSIEAEASMNKALCAELDLEMSDLAMDILGRDGLIKGSDGPLGGKFEREYRKGVFNLVAGGTHDIQKNVIAIHGLKLPRR